MIFHPLFSSKSFLRLFLLPVLVLVLFFNQARGQFYNGFQMEFGKNRVQYDEFLWSFYRFEKFDTYFYLGGKELAVYTAKTAQQHLDKIQSLFDYELESRVQFIIYNKQSQFRESNIGITEESESAVGGVTRIAGTKVFLYFEGDHAKLDKQIRAGLAEVLINEMLFGGNWKEVIKNSALLTLPDWYMKGLISYASEPWNTEIENYVKDGVLSERYRKFNRLADKDAVYAGHSLWNYIVEAYGQRVLSNIVYMTRISRNVESGFLFVLGSSLSSLTHEWMNYYYNKYNPGEQKRMLPVDSKLALRIKKNRVYSQFRMNADGSKAAFVTNELGQFKVFVYDLATGKKKRIMKRENKLNRINDYSYPILNWHPNGEILTIILEEEAKPFILHYEMSSEEIIEKPLFVEKVLTFDYSDDGKKIVYAGIAKGQSDIFLYNVGANTQEQITNDIFDDIDPKFIQKSQAVIFASNRENDSLKTTSESEIQYHISIKDLFIYDVKSKSKVLKRVTNTPKVDETHPMLYDDNRFSFLSNENGVRNRFVATFDSVISFIDTATHYRYYTTSSPQTNYSRSIIEHHVAPKAKKTAEIIFNKGKYGLYQGTLAADVPDSIKGFNVPPYFGTNEARKKVINDKPSSAAEVKDPEFRIGKDLTNVNDDKLEQDTTKKIEKPGEIKPRPRFQTVKAGEEDTIAGKKEIDINNYEFSQTPTNKVETKVQEKEKVKIPKDSISGDSLKEFMLPKQRNYKVIYFTDYVVSQLNNNFMSQSYQRFTGGTSPVYQNAGFNGVFKVGVSDLFENRRIVGGVRLSPDLVNNEYFLSFEDLTRRWDKQYIFHRLSQTDVDQFTLTKVNTNEIKYVVKYPISEVLSARGMANFRHDRIVRLATDYQTLQEPNKNDFWLNLKAEYVFDNTLPKGMNAFNGTRAKVFIEMYKHVENKYSQVFIAGLDARHYLKIHRDFIWANRLAASTSFGPQKLIYYMGGVDGWLFPKFDNSIQVDQSRNYVFQAVATNMRGFHQNARNGSNFAVINSELRLPLFKYIMNKPIRSDFIRNFQVIAFSDIGSAWSGPNPYKDNNLNTTLIYSNPFTIRIDNQKQPIISSYGWGMRSTIFGYFVRLDWAWGIDDGVILPRIFYLSLNLDF